MSERTCQRSRAAFHAALFAAMTAAFLVSCGQKSEEQKTAPAQRDSSSSQATSDALEKAATEKVTPHTPAVKPTSTETRPETADHEPAGVPSKTATAGTAANPVGKLLNTIDRTLKGKRERAETGAKSDVHVPAIGELAPDIEAEDIDGVPFKLSDYRGYVIVLDFWGDW